MIFQVETVCLNFILDGNEVVTPLSIDCHFSWKVVFDNHSLSSSTIWFNKSFTCSLYHVKKVNLLFCIFIFCFGSEHAHSFHIPVSSTQFYEEVSVSKIHKRYTMMNHLLFLICSTAPNLHSTKILVLLINMHIFVW